MTFATPPPQPPPSGSSNLVSIPEKSDPTVRRVLTRWRSLTGGAASRDADRRTLVALSGGADSSALLLALSTQSRHVVAAHIVHDMRSAADSEADRAACEGLCRALGVTFVSASVSVRGQGNVEAVARRERYRSLMDLAQQAGCRFIATGHQAQDQLETVLMRVLRGAGPRGLRGIAARRGVGADIAIVRPMLELTRSQAESLCTACGWVWRIDATNSDAGRLRSRLRRDVIPLLESISPGVARRSNAIAASASSVFQVTRGLGSDLLQRSQESPASWSRRLWRAAPRAVVAEAIVQIIRGAGGTARHREIVAAARAARGASGEARHFQFEGCTLIIDANTIRVAPRTAS